MCFEVKFDMSTQVEVKVEEKGWPWDRYKRITVEDIETGAQHTVDTKHGVEVVWTNGEGS